MMKEDPGNQTQEVIRTTPEQAEMNLEEAYGEEFEVVDLEEEGRTVGGKWVSNAYHMRAMEDGTEFRYVVQPDGEIDDYYPPMKLGNQFYEDKIKQTLEAWYGEGNVIGQVIVSPGKEIQSEQALSTYLPEEDSQKSIDVFLAIKTDSLDKSKEAERLASLYNGLEGYTLKGLEVGFFSEFPSTIHQFLVYETTGLQDSFQSFYESELLGLVSLFSTFDGNQLTPEEMAAMFFLEGSEDE
jgi:hypothetical protein